MRIITEKTMTCRTCDTTFEYNDKEMLIIPGYGNMKVLVCPKCGQQIIMVADEFKEADKRIILEEENGRENKSE